MNDKPTFLLIIGLAFALRVYQLGFQPLWGDEGWSFYFAVQTVPDLLALTAQDIHPPLYYLLLKLWLTIAGMSAETARFLSVICGTLLVPVSYAFGRRFVDGRVGLVTALLTAVLPMAVYYSHEVRMYGLVTLLGLVSFYAWVRVTQRGQKRAYGPTPLRWHLLYLLSTTALLYTMYFAVFIVAAQVSYLALLWFSPPRTHAYQRPPLMMFRRWVGLLAGVALLYLPWIIYATPKLLAYIQNKRAVEGYTPPNLPSFINDHVIAFSLGHLPDLLLDYRGLAWLFATVVTVGLFVTLSKRQRYTYLHLYLFIPILLGWTVNQIFPFTPPTYERTLLIAAPAFWLFLATGWVWLWDRAYPVAGLVAGPILVLIGVALHGYYQVPRYSAEDYRPLLRDIAASATPEDVLLASYQWQLGFYHAYLPEPRPRIEIVPQWGVGWDEDETGTRPQMEADLNRFLAESPRLWFPAFQAEGHIWEDAAEAMIAELGYPALLEWYSPEIKLTLAGQMPTDAKDFENPLGLSNANFDDRLTLAAAQVGQAAYQSGRDIIPIRLTWRKTGSLGSDHLVSIRLADETGRTWSIRDSHPNADQYHLTDLSVGETLLDQHGLLIAAGLRPGTYRLLLSVRRTADAHPLDLLSAEGQPQGVEALLGEVQIIDPNPPIGPAAFPLATPADTNFDDLTTLVGYTLPHGPHQAGNSLPLTLFWQAQTDFGQQSSVEPIETNYQVQLELLDQTGQVVGAYQRPPHRPTDEWHADLLIRDPHEMPLPPTLPAGDYQPRLHLLTPDGQAVRRDGVLLNPIQVIDRPRNYEQPTPLLQRAINFSDQIQLVGLDLPQSPLQAGESLPLTLHWQALSTPDRNWKVFVHLVDEAGQIIAQQDQVPGGGQFPTAGWLADEYLADGYQLIIPTDTPAGQYHLRFGFYDPNDFSRLPVVERGEVIADHVALKEWGIVVE